MRARIPACVLCLAAVVIVSNPSARAQADPPRAALVRILDSSITNSRGFFWNRLYARRAIYPNNWMDWSTAYCNRTPMPSGYDFKRACVRRDFGYANVCGFNTSRAKMPMIDANFLADLRATCHARGAACEVTATAFARRVGSPAC